MLESPYIKIDEHGINLLRNYQVVNHIDFQEIQKVDLIKGHLINNWILSLFISLLLTLISSVWLLKSIISINTPLFEFSFSRGFITINYILPLLFIVGGAIWLFVSLKRCAVIIISTDKSKYKVAIKEFESNNRIAEFIEFLSERVRLNILHKDYG